jgi:hypothetical protein
MNLKHTHLPMKYEIGQNTTKDGCLAIDEKKLRSLIVQAVVKIDRISSNVSPTLGNTNNMIDPTAAIFEIATLHGFDKELWSKSEVMRSKQKSLMNIIGDLQQSIIGTIPGWVSHPTATSSPDIEGDIIINGKKIKILGEVKNKHNTLNGDSKDNVVKKMNDFLSIQKYNKAVPMVVQIVKPSYNQSGQMLQLWGCSKGVRILSGRNFYALAANPIIDFDILDISPKSSESKFQYSELNTILSFDCMNEYIFFYLEEITKGQFDFSITDYIKTQNM